MPLRFYRQGELCHEIGGGGIVQQPTAEYGELSERRCLRTARWKMRACFSACDQNGSLSPSDQQRQPPQKKRRSAKYRLNFSRPIRKSAVGIGWLDEFSISSSCTSKHCLVTPLKSRLRGTRMGTTAANRHLRCPLPCPPAPMPAPARPPTRPRPCLCAPACLRTLALPGAGTAHTSHPAT